MATAAGCAICHTAWNNIMINHCEICERLVCGKCWKSSQCMSCLNAREKVPKQCDLCKKGFFYILRQKKIIKIFVCAKCENTCCDSCLVYCFACDQAECAKCHTNTSHTECADCEKKRKSSNNILNIIKNLLN
jgi:hypothetical protein